MDIETKGTKLVPDSELAGNDKSALNNVEANYNTVYYRQSYKNYTNAKSYFSLNIISLYYNNRKRLFAFATTSLPINQ